MLRAIFHHRRARRITPRRPLVAATVAVHLVVYGLLGCGLVAAGSGAGAVYAYSQMTRDLPAPDGLVGRPLPQVTRFYDRTGQQLLYEVYDERRVVVPLDQIAPPMILATLAIEDAGFYSHGGYDPRGIARAAVDNLRSRETVAGGSTITQQLVKRMLLSDERTYLRKVRELVLATQVEAFLPKERILELYLNQVYYGNQAYGVEAAALTYFGKPARDLSLAEASLLAGLVQLPSFYDPLANLEAALARQQQVLDAMVRHGMVAPEQAAQAREQSAAFTFRYPETTIVAPHFAFYAKEQLLQRVDPALVRQGLKVITTLDLELQERAQAIVRRRVDEIRWQQVNNGALVALSPKTGEILAMVGSYDYDDAAIDGQVNVATAPRQPGSSFKPLTYATAFATRRYFPASLVADEPLSLPDPSSATGFYRPANYDRSWHGSVTLRSALANSYNIPALLVQDAVGTAEVIKTARKMGLTTDLPEVPSLTLGAGSVQLLEMTAAYGVLANHGVRVEPTPFLEITTLDGQKVWQLEPYEDREIWPQVAYLVTDVLADAAARRPAFGTVLNLANGRTAAVKTGTTNDYKDSWTIGYTPSLAVGVWVGNTDNSPMLQVAGSLGAGYIWKDFMDQTLAGQPDEPFPVPDRVARAPVCSDRPEVEVFMEGPPPSCPETLRAGPEWRVGLPGTALPSPARRGR